MVEGHFGEELELGCLLLIDNENVVSEKSHVWLKVRHTWWMTW